MTETTQTQRTLDLLRKEWTRPYREALEAIQRAATISEPIESPLNRLAGIAEEARIALKEN